jgi:hypothetical protein
LIASGTSTKLSLDPPGPGHWEQDPVHLPRPMTRYFQETHPPAFKKGTNDFARFYGRLIDGLQIGYVKGFGYNQVLQAPEAEIAERFRRAPNKSSPGSYGGNSCATGMRTASHPPYQSIGSCRPLIRTLCPTPNWLAT